MPAESERLHTWQPTLCELCHGSGQLAAFYEEFVDADRHKRELRLQKVLQYEGLKDYTPNPDWIRFYFRCSCANGELDTLPKGMPRWDAEKGQYIQRKFWEGQ